MYIHVEVELRIFYFFAPVQILLHVILTHYNSTIPTIMITYMYKLQSTTVFYYHIPTNIFLHADKIINSFRCRPEMTNRWNNFVLML